MTSNQLIIGGRAHEVGCRTVTFQDPGGFSAYLETCSPHSNGRCGPNGSAWQPAAGLQGQTRRYRYRHAVQTVPRVKDLNWPAPDPSSVKLARALVKQFVVHLDGCHNAVDCFDVLHNERGLSCHFILDNDGTIYQTLDLLDCAYHASGLNETSIGIELCNRGNALLYPSDYDHAPAALRREKMVCTINNEKYVSYDFTVPQMKAMTELGKALARHLPGIKLTYPQTANGEQRWDTLDPDDKLNERLRDGYSGYIGHYHLTNQKWDPGPFDFRRFLSTIAGRRRFPIGLHELAEVPEAPGPNAKPAERKAYDDAFETYYRNNEGGPGGFFPVGPIEATRLWHGGIHLFTKEPGANVVAPFPGRVVVARNGPAVGDVGSTSFVLLSHTLTVGGELVVFYSLYEHLAEEKKGPDAPAWMARSEAWRAADPRQTTLLGTGEPVQAGELIGHVGSAGPDGQRHPQLHWEIFSADANTVLKLDRAKGFWVPISGSSDQRFCTNPEILDRIDKRPKDGVVSSEELAAAYRDSDFREWTHHLIASHYSEWADAPSWRDALHAAPELSAAEADEIYEKQIEGGLWLTSEIAQQLGLSWPPMVYTYHPVSFLKWVNGLQGSPRESAVHKPEPGDLATASRSGKVDIDDTKGEFNLGPGDGPGRPPPPQPDLMDMADGYQD